MAVQKVVEMENYLGLMWVDWLAGQWGMIWADYLVVWKVLILVVQKVCHLAEKLDRLMVDW